MSKQALVPYLGDPVWRRGRAEHDAHLGRQPRAGLQRCEPPYSHDRVVLGIPPAPTPEEDRQLLREIGRKVVEDCQRLTQTN